ncbi:MAG: tetratricopeptide repeat protein [Filomicrobium sp.]
MRSIYSLLFGFLALTAIPTICGIAFAGREQVHIEMVETLEAYAVYKMGRYEDAFEAWLALAEKGNAQGILNVANMYLAGEGVPKDPRKAISWYRKGAEQGDPHCLLNLAKAYETGDGIEPDQDKAKQFFERAAGAGASEAQIRVAQRHLMLGETGQARVWLERAAGKGEQLAMAMLANLEPSPAADETTVSVSERRRIDALVADMDAAANARDANWLTKAVRENAVINIQLPGQPEFQQLTKDEYRKLWEVTFSKTERYRFARNDHQIKAGGKRIILHSKIREYLTTNSRTEELILNEELALSAGPTGRLTIDRVTLSVTRAY